MPVLYQSYGLPGGLERGKNYRGKRFHDDLTIKPIPAEVLGREYLDQIEGMLCALGGAAIRLPALVVGIGNALGYFVTSSMLYAWILIFVGGTMPRASIHEPETTAGLET